MVLVILCGCLDWIITYYYRVLRYIVCYCEWLYRSWVFLLFAVSDGLVLLILCVLSCCACDVELLWVVVLFAEGSLFGFAGAVGC